MKYTEIQPLPVSELKKAIAEERQRLHALQFQAHERQLKQTHQMRMAKKTISRLLTALRAKEQAPTA